MSEKITNILYLPSENPYDPVDIYSPSCTCAVRSTVVIRDNSGNELFKLEYLNDLSEFKISVGKKPFASRTNYQV